MRRLPSLPVRCRPRVAATAALAAGALLALPAHAASSDRDEGRAEVRARGTCGVAATAELRLRGEDGSIELEFEVDGTGRPGPWRVVVVHERRVAWRGTVRARGSSGSFEMRRVLRDLAGADMVTIRTWGPQGAGCRATATLKEA